jgi:hypothetical protein
MTHRFFFAACRTPFDSCWLQSRRALVSPRWLNVREESYMIIVALLLIYRVHVSPVSVECLKNLAVDEVSVEELVDEGCLTVCPLIILHQSYFLFSSC